MEEFATENKIKDLEDENYRLKEELDYDLFSTREAFRIVVESNLDPIIGIDNNCCIMLFNPAAEDMFQYVEKELLFKPVEILFKEDVEEEYHNKLIKFLNEGIFERDLLNKTTEVHFKRRDGSYFEGETSFAVGRGKSNLYIVLTIRDISYRKKIERELIESEAKARTLLDTPHQSIILVDIKGNILDCNKSSLQFFSSQRSETIGKNITCCKNIIINRDILFKIDWVFSSAEILRYETRIKDELYDNIIYPVIDKNGKVFQAVLVTNNITDFQQEHKLFDSDDIISINQKFLSDLKHEFRTPISGTMGMINLLNRTNLDNNQKELVSIIKDSSEYLNNLFDNFFDFLTLFKQKIQLTEQAFNIKNTVENLISSHIAFKKSNEIDLKIVFQKGLPDNISTDESRYRQIFGNIFFHAIRQINKGNVLITLSVLDRNKSSASIKTEINCTNLLITDEEAGLISGIFTGNDLSPFSIDNFKDTEYYVARILAELMGGKIGLINNSSNNFTFWFTINAEIS